MVRCSYSIDAQDASVSSGCVQSHVQCNCTRSRAAVLHKLHGSACALDNRSVTADTVNVQVSAACSLPLAPQAFSHMRAHTHTHTHILQVKGRGSCSDTDTLNSWLDICVIRL